MLHVLHGTDYKPLRKKLESLRSALAQKRPNAEFFTLDDERFSPARLDEFIESRGLFEDKYIVTLDRCFLDESAREEIMGRLEEIADSPHAFILVAGEVSDVDTDTLASHAERIWGFNRHNKGADKEDDYTVFDLTDAFGRRDSKEAWVEYQKALDAGEDPASLHGMLFWQVKSMILAQQTEDADEANMSAYPYKKANGFCKNFTDEELYQLSSQLVDVYHRARDGEYELREKLEEVLLGL